MKINYYIVNPGGNITAIVQGKFAKRIKLKITKNISKNNSTIEQVGFWTNAKNKNFDARLEMAGGEFCGNALRSLGAILAFRNKNNLCIVESSGLKIKIKSSTKSSSVSLKLDLLKYENNIYSMPGIKYFLSKRIFTKLTAKKVLNKNKLLENKAAGVISYKTIGVNKYEINPIVWVKDTTTLYEETACGSGTLALAYMLYKKMGIKKLNIKQPSGFVFRTKITKKEIIISGPIISVKKENINI